MIFTLHVRMYVLLLGACFHSFIMTDTKDYVIINFCRETLYSEILWNNRKLWKIFRRRFESKRRTPELHRSVFRALSDVKDEAFCRFSQWLSVVNYLGKNCIIDVLQGRECASVSAKKWKLLRGSSGFGNKINKLSENHREAHEMTDKFNTNRNYKIVIFVTFV